MNVKVNTQWIDWVRPYGLMDVTAEATTNREVLKKKPAANDGMMVREYENSILRYNK